MNRNEWLWPQTWQMHFHIEIVEECRRFQDWHTLCLVLALAHSMLTKCMQITVAPAVLGSVHTPLSEHWAAVRTTAGDEPDKAPDLICRQCTRPKSQPWRESLDSYADYSVKMRANRQSDKRDKCFRPKYVGSWLAKSTAVSFSSAAVAVHETAGCPKECSASV